MKKKSATSASPKNRNDSAAEQRVGGQPENDEDARAAGMKSATSEEPRVPSAPAQPSPRRKR